MTTPSSRSPGQEQKQKIGKDNANDNQCTYSKCTVNGCCTKPGQIITEAMFTVAVKHVTPQMTGRGRVRLHDKSMLQDVQQETFVSCVRRYLNGETTLTGEACLCGAMITAFEYSIMSANRANKANARNLDAAQREFAGMIASDSYNALERDNAIAWAKRITLKYISAPTARRTMLKFIEFITNSSFEGESFSAWLVQEPGFTHLSEVAARQYLHRARLYLYRARVALRDTHETLPKLAPITAKAATKRGNAAKTEGPRAAKSAPPPDGIL